MVNSISKYKTRSLPACSDVQQNFVANEYCIFQLSITINFYNVEIAQTDRIFYFDSYTCKMKDARK